jgi:quercetin dioxygenase-like cupin family protein
MTTSSKIRLAALFTGAMLFTAAQASAGQCPADKVTASGGGQKAGATMPKGVVDTVLGSIDLANEPVGVDDRKFRLRRLEIEPGGIVPWHSHDDRPALIYVVKGTVMEYASTCAVPIVHKAGEVSTERRGTAHWWKNTGKTAAVLISADLLRDPKDEHMM